MIGEGGPKEDRRLPRWEQPEEIIITEKLIKKLIAVINKGLVYGMGDPVPGQMCVEAAVCYVLGYEHDDEPRCVHDDLGTFKIHVNDLRMWSSDKKRAAGLRRLAIMQLNTLGKLNWDVFSKAMSRWVIRNLPPLLVGEGNEKLRKAAARCAKTPTWDNAVKFAAQFREANPEDRDEWWMGEFESFCAFPTERFNELILFLTMLPIERKAGERFLFDLCEASVQQLIKMKMPGSDYVELAPLKK